MNINKIDILIRGAGEMATGIACRLYKSNFKKICMTEISRPLAVRRGVSFCEVIYEGEKSVEGVSARCINSYEQIRETWEKGFIPVIVDPDAKLLPQLKPDVVIDAIMAKKNLNTRITDADLVIGVGPGFFAGGDVHLVVESNRGHNLGKVIYEGEAEKDTGIPGAIRGIEESRVLRSPKKGTIKIVKEIGVEVTEGEEIASVEGAQVFAEISGMLRGMIRNETIVQERMKIGDIDPRNIKEYCYTISDKSRAIGGGVLEAILATRA